MILDVEKINEFEILVKPLIKFLNDNANPHAIIIVETGGARILSGVAGVVTDEFIHD